LPKNQEEYWPLYKKEKEGGLGQDNEEEKAKLEKMFDITPTTYDAVITLLLYKICYLTLFIFLKIFILNKNIKIFIYA